MALAGSHPISGSRFTSLVAVSAVLFFISLIPTELIPEIPVDIDFKPYFLPLMLVALLPVGRATLAVGLGVALGEGLRDLLEGYEIDDPIGFVAYIVAFVVAGYVIGVRPLNKAVLMLGAIVCGAVQGVMEASSFVLFGEEGIDVALATAVGNTITHGVIMGGIPLIFVVPALHGRFERYLGFPTKGAPEPGRSLTEIAGGGRIAAAPEAAKASVQGLWFRYPGLEEPALRGIDLGVRAGEVLGLMGPSGAGKSTLCLCLAGVAPRDTGGEIVGRIRVDGCDVQAAPSHEVAGHVGIATESVTAQVTHVTPLGEVAAALMNRGQPREQAHTEAAEWLDRLGLARDLHTRRNWELSEGELRQVLLAACLAAEPGLVVLDGIVDGLDAPGREHLRRVLGEAAGKSVLLVDNDPDLLLEWTDRVAVMVDGAVLRVGPSADVLADRELLGRAGFEPPLRCRPGYRIAAASAEDAPVLQRPDRRIAAAAPSPSQPLLELQGVAYRYSAGPLALDGVQLRVAAGEALAVIGPHGSGKTTLAKIGAGLLAPDAGEALVEGRPAATLDPAGRMRTVGLTFTDPDQAISERTVGDEIAFALHRIGMSRDEARRRAADAAGRTGLPQEILAQDPTALPLGRRKQVTIAAAVAREPRLLILDEPVAGLDGAERRDLLKTLSKLKGDGIALVLLDHRADFAVELADRVVLLKAGRIVTSGTPLELFGADAWPRVGIAEIDRPLAARIGEELGIEAVRRNDLLRALETA